MVWKLEMQNVSACNNVRRATLTHDQIAIVHWDAPVVTIYVHAGVRHAVCIGPLAEYDLHRSSPCSPIIRPEPEPCCLGVIRVRSFGNLPDEIQRAVRAASVWAASFMVRCTILLVTPANIDDTASCQARSLEHR